MCMVPCISIFFHANKMCYVMNIFDILYKISVFLIENVSLKRHESFLLNKIINNKLTKMFFCAALVLLFIKCVNLVRVLYFVA